MKAITSESPFDINDYPYKCAQCGGTEWFGDPMPPNGTFAACKKCKRERYLQLVDACQGTEQQRLAADGYEEVSHPAHYGGADNPYEAVKVIEAWNLGFNLGNTVKYISRAGSKPGADVLKDLKKALWYLQRECYNLEKQRCQPPSPSTSSLSAKPT